MPIWAIDADSIIVRPDPRLVTGVEALAAMLARDGGTGQLTDELIGQVAQVVRPVRRTGMGRRGRRWRPARPRLRGG